MRKIIFFCALTLPLSWSKPSKTSFQLIQEINSRQTSWKAGLNSLKNIKSRLGFLGLHPDSDYKIATKHHKIDQTSIPETFDARDKWPECKDFIGNIRDQGACGSCWAFASTEVMSDRLCIVTNGETKFEFSPENLLTCCEICRYNCVGGYTAQAWNFLINEGIVSGGDYNSSEGCQPYSESAFKNGVVPKCVKTCQNNNYDVKYNDDKHYGDSFYTLETNVSQIQVEIMTNGPVMATFNVFEDFVYYQDGVYYHVSGEMIARHVVKVIGWGTENGVPYWLIANSWGTWWGKLEGFVKIRQETNECAIEQEMAAGEVHIGNKKSTTG
ncbi:cathepsin B-like cysteine proteinase 4 isoform X2 [Tribolium madens]|uniref:cathepsin B-like cysteine proteinase 4 isoform X2 n=1 Tax=Tribolium madens TaxID=41895 RepID=UPI001CF760F4|nr:cathepsin B-like cysteine proteinase 4 isoform X2 [Tribolium madens]